MKIPFAALLLGATVIFCPLRAGALEERPLPDEMLRKISGAVFTRPGTIRDFTLYSPGQKLWISFVASYSSGDGGARFDCDHVFVFRDELAKNALAFYIYMNNDTVTAHQILTREFHPGVPTEVFDFFPAVAMTPHAVVASYYLDESNFTTSVFLREGRVESKTFPSGKLKTLRPEPLAVTAPEIPPPPFDLPLIVAVGKTLPDEPLSVRTRREFDGGFVIRTTKENVYYIKETAEGIHLGCFVKGELIANGNLTRDRILTRVRGEGARLLALSEFKPFKCRIFIESPRYPGALLLNVHGDTAPGSVISVHTVTTE